MAKVDMCCLYIILTRHRRGSEPNVSLLSLGEYPRVLILINESLSCDHANAISKRIDKCLSQMCDQCRLDCVLLQGNFHLVLGEMRIVLYETGLKRARTR